MQTGHRGSYHGGHSGGDRGPPPSQGSRGGTVYPVRVNVFEILRLPSKPFYQYDITPAVVKSDRPPRLPSDRKQDIIDRMVQQHAHVFTPPPAYDGQKNIWAGGRYQFPSGGDSAVFDVNMSMQNPPVSNRGMFKVAIKFAAMIDPTSINGFLSGGGATQRKNGLAAVMLLQQLVRSAPNQAHPARNLRSVFPMGMTRPIGGGLIAWRGYFQSVRPTIGRALVNVNTTTSAAYRSGRLYEVALEVISSRGHADTRMFLEIHQDRRAWNKLRSFFKGVHVTIDRGNNHQGRNTSRPIKDLVPNAGHFEFTDRDGHIMTVAKYYRDTYGKELQNPRMWGVKVGSDAVIPGELCVIAPHQLFKKKIPSELTADMLNFAEQSPSTKIGAIEEAVRGTTLGWTNSTVLNDANMQIRTEALRVDAKSLPMPRVQYKDQSARVAQEDGSWNVVRQRFVKPAVIKRWAVIKYHGDDRVVNPFIRQLTNNLNNLGVAIESAPVFVSATGQNIPKDFEQIGQMLDGAPDIVVAVLNFPAPDIRRAFKHYSLTKLPVATQCVVYKKISNERGLDQYCNNLALKINVKLGGVNAVVEDEGLNAMKNTPTMFLGADVTHPGPGIHNRPSVAALVWSTDRDFTRYNSLASIQSPRTEIIDDLCTMIKAALIDFSKRNSGTMPATMVMFRDGVSEGEFEYVKTEEGAAIKSAIDQLWVNAPKDKNGRPPPQPKLTFIVVGKRHHIRMFPQFPPQPDNRGKIKGGGNCPPGVLIDQHINSPYAEDWYLLSHGGLKGTSVPAHYIILINEAGIPSGLIQQFSYALCYSYHRATRAVSIPAPVYYADLVCSHADFQFTDNVSFTDETNTVSSDEFDLNQWRDGFKQIAPILRERFYYL